MMNLHKAVSLLEQRLDYYETVHTAQCACWTKGHHENLKYCTCSIGKAFTALRAAAGVGGAPVESKLDPSWQPMDTAPKDFTPVLLWWIYPIGNPGIVLARWTCATHMHLARRHDCPHEPDCAMGWLRQTAGFPTHWMPLPDPPVGGAPEEKK